MFAWLLAAAFALLIHAVGVHAHASLLSAVPDDGAVLRVSPQQAVLHFDETVRPLSLRLVDEAGRVTPLRVPEVSGDTVTADLPALPQRGNYLLSYRVISADTHPVAGSIAFAVGPTPVAVLMESHDPVAELGTLLDKILRALRDVALLVASGGALYACLLERDYRQHWQRRRWLAGTGAAAALLTVLLIGTHGMALTGERPWQALSPWLTAAGTTLGMSAAATLAGLTLIALATSAAAMRRVLFGKTLLAAGALTCAASLALTGHAATRPLAAPLLALHVLAASFWVGAVVLLYAGLRSGNVLLMPALRRFSRWAPVAVGVLVAAGGTFALLQLRQPRALLDTPYGNWLLVKLALLAALLGLAAYNRYRLQPRLESGDLRAGHALRRSLSVEMVLMAAVIAATAILVHTSPPPREVLLQHLTAGPYAVVLTADVAAHEAGTLALTFRRQDGHAFDPAEVTLAMANPAAGIAPLTRTLAREGEGAYRYSGRELAIAGDWTVTIAARIGDFERVTWTTTLHTGD